MKVSFHFVVVALFIWLEASSGFSFEDFPRDDYLEKICKSSSVVAYDFTDYKLEHINSQFIRDPRVQRLDLSSNEIVSVPTNVFGNNSQLCSLNLSNNAIDLQRFFEFDGHAKLRIISVDGNRPKKHGTLTIFDNFPCKFRFFSNLENC